jgi:iron-sulfur cluster assembly protein
MRSLTALETASQSRRTLLYYSSAPEALNLDPQLMTELSTSTARRPRPQVMTLTPAAADRIRSLMASKGPEVAGLKIGIKKGGCAGMEYTMSWADKVGRLDEVVEVDGARLIIDPQAILYLIGTEMDFQSDKLASQFVFHNPNQKSACGCGESVQLEPAQDASLDPAQDK